MNNPNQIFETYKYLSEATIYKMFPNPIGIAQKHRIELSDLLQYAACGLWKGCLSYNPNKGTHVTTHLINNIRWHVNERLNRETSMIKYNPNSPFDPYILISMDAEINDTEKDHNTYHDVIASDDIDVLENVIGDIEVKHILSQFNDKDRKVIELKIKDKTPNEISKITGTSASNVRMKLCKIKSQLCNLNDSDFKSKQGSKNKTRKVCIEGKIFDGIDVASKELCIKYKTLWSRINSNSDRYEKWHYVS